MRFCFILKIWGFQDLTAVKTVIYQDSLAFSTTDEQAADTV